MNSVPNSDSEQCTESKLSRVHSAPILGPAYAHTAPCRWPGCVAGLAWQCRKKTPGRVAAHARAPCRRAPPRSAARRVALTAGRIMAVSPAMSQPVLRYNPAAKPPSCHDTPIRIATQSPSSQALARAPLALARRSALSQGLSTVSQAESLAVSLPSPVVS